MYDNDSKGISYTAGFFMLICFVLAGLVVTSQLMEPIWTRMTGKSVDLLRKGIIVPEDSNALKVIQLFTAILGFFVPSVLAAAMLNRRPFRLLGFSTQGIKGGQLGLVVLLIGTSLLVSSSLSYITEMIPLPGSWQIKFDEMEADYNRQVSAIISLKSTGDYIIALIVMAFIPAVCEEALFRGGLQNFMTRASGRAWLSILVVSILFSLAHISYYGFLSRIFLGIVLGFIFHYSGKLWLSILAHFINNALAITVLYYYTRQGKPLQQAMQENEAGLWGLIALPIVLGLFVAFSRISNSQSRA